MTERRLRIASNLTLPAEAVTETFAILAKRGVGKTYTASVFAEELLGAGFQTVIADPIGVWWGLRSSADGKAGGLPIAIFGGDHADVPLEASGGKLVADLVVDERLSCVLDLSLLRKGQTVEFMTAFAETLYHRNRAPLQLILDEADAFAPQKPYKGQERLLGAVEDLVRRGRARGIGVTLVTQRSAVLNKDVLTQAEVLVALRTIAPQDREAIDAWIRVHGTPEQREELMASLPSLPIGEAWIWSPGWLDVFQRVKVRQRRTFDSSATPKAGQARQQPRTVADVDLEAIRAAMADTIEKAAASDPRKLQARIRELEVELTRTPAPAEPVVERIEVPVLNGEVERLEQVVDRFMHVGKSLSQTAVTLGQIGGDLVDVGGEIMAAIASARGQEQGYYFRSPPPPPAAAARPPRPPVPPRDREVESGRPLKAGARRMLQALAQLHPTPLTRQQMATLADISPASGTFTDYLSALRQGGFIQEHQDGTLSLSSVGELAFAGDIGSGAPTVDELVAMWGRKLKAGARRMLDALVADYPGGLTRQQLADRAEISVTSGTFTDYLSALRRVGLLDESQGDLRAGPALFIGGR